MPRIDLRDPSGVSYQIATLDPQLLQAWFDEWLPRLYPPDMSDDYGDPAVQVQPLWAGHGPGDVDWPADTRFVYDRFIIPRDPALALAALQGQREFIERAIAAAKTPGS